MILKDLGNWLSQHSPLIYLTQSLWRDEAVAWVIARKPIADIMVTSINDFNPPLHYILLHYWMKLFGQSEISLRSLSFIFFLFLVLASFLFSQSLIKGRWRFFFPLFFLLNPMLIHYAFEVRMYSMFALFSFLSTFSLYKGRWLSYIVFSVLGLYTHSYMPLTLISHFVYIILQGPPLQRVPGRPLLKRMPFFPFRQYLYSLLAILVFYLPWMPVVIYQFIRSKQSWIYPIDWQLVFSSLGNLFINYEGTPGNWWWATRLLSLIILSVSFLSLYKRFDKSLLFFIWGFLPLSIVLLVSTVKPMFVNRYLIPTTVSMVILVAIGLTSVSRERLRFALCFFAVLILIFINLTLPSSKQKMDTRAVFQTISQQVDNNDIVLTDILLYFDGLYYLSFPDRAYVYYPGGDPPVFVGTAIIDKEKILKKIPENRSGFLVERSGSFTRFN